MEPIHTFLCIVVIVGAFYTWHYNWSNKLNEKIHKLELDIKELEKKDALQQSTIDQLNQLFPIIYDFIIKRGGKDDSK